MTTYVAFFYGTLVGPHAFLPHDSANELQMAPEVLYRVLRGRPVHINDPVHKEFSERLTISDAILQDHSRRPIKEVHYPGMIPQKGHTVSKYNKNCD